MGCTGLSFRSSGRCGGVKQRAVAAKCYQSLQRSGSGHVWPICERREAEDGCNILPGLHNRCKNPIPLRCRMSISKSRRWQKLGSYRRTCRIGGVWLDRLWSFFFRCRTMKAGLKQGRDVDTCGPLRHGEVDGPGDNLRVVRLVRNVARLPDRSHTNVDILCPPDSIAGRDCSRPVYTSSMSCEDHTECWACCSVRMI